MRNSARAFTRTLAPAPGAQFSSVIETPRGRHSEKPAIVRDMITEKFPNLPKLEMFARGKRVSGWDFFGNEIEETAPFNGTNEIPARAGMQS